MIPNFIIAGASRSGTTTLFNQLRTHSEIFMPPQKELRFFDCTGAYLKGLDYYRSLFKGTREGMINGEASPPYFYKNIVIDEGRKYKWSPGDDAPSRIKQSFPDVKIIITLRNPINRAYSQFWKNVWNANEFAKTFEEAIEQELSGRRKPQETGMCWLYKNSYSIHVSRWLELFDRRQILFLVFEEWIKAPEKHLAKMADFIGCKKAIHYDASSKNMNQGRVPRLRRYPLLPGSFRGNRYLKRIYRELFTRRGYPELKEKTRLLLQSCFEDDIARLEQLLSISLSVWGKGG